MAYRIGAAARIWMGLCLLAVLPSGVRADSRAQIDEGIRLHDQGKFDEAIAAFRTVLESEPDNAEAIYEISNSLMSAERYTECAENASSNLDKAGRFRVMYLTIQASCIDTAGDPSRAAELFEQALVEFPEFQGLAFNAGITRLRLGQLDAAKELFKREIRLRPNHPSSHLMLGKAFDESGFVVPALLAYLRFLALEPEGPRAAQTATQVLEILGRGFTKKSEKEYEIQMLAKPSKAEGDYEAVALMIPLAAAVVETEDFVLKTAGEKLVHRVETVLAVLVESSDGESTDFSSETYLPFFRELREVGLLEPFVYRFAAPVSEPSFAEWLAAHPDRVAALEGHLRATARP